MNDQPVSREALLRSLDSLEQICNKRIENVRLIDDEELPRFIKSIKCELHNYGVRNTDSALSKISSEFPERITIHEIPFSVAFLLFPMMTVLFISICTMNLFYAVIICLPVILLVLLFYYSIYYWLKRRRKETFTKITAIVMLAKKELSTI